ncbi:triose-phosphate isomerase [Buchnera aphidicola]|uniref:triose-phosphate isomerase n=1 Tax=Buchnera aphidicola TaxID=9 RepID=UPI0034642179
MKNFTIVSNWKLNGNNNTIYNFITKLKKYFLIYPIVNNIIFVPPVVYSNNIKNEIKNTKFFLGAQNVDINISGAFTGEISIKMLQDIGIKYVIIGHSERRMFHNETNKYIAQKFQIIKKYNMIPILCVGETFKEKQLCQTYDICKKQINIILNLMGKYAFRNSIIAYEPIWAIGSGKTADIQYIQKIHKFLRSYICDHSDINSDEIIIQYGGSVTSKNIKLFFEEPEINGVLLGGSSLIYDEFIKIIKITNTI